MNKYKPEYMGRVMPADDPTKLTRFVRDQYGAFTKIYDACKEYSDKISDVTSVQAEGEKVLSVKLSTDTGTIDNIKEAVSDDGAIAVTGDVISACSE